MVLFWMWVETFHETSLQTKRLYKHPYKQYTMSNFSCRHPTAIYFAGWRKSLCWKGGGV